MAVEIKLKRSAVAGSVPSHGTTISTGEVALNTADGIIYFSDGSIVKSIKGHSVSTSAPTSPSPQAGDIWYDSTNELLKIYNGSAWNLPTGADAISNITVTDTDSGYTWAETGSVAADAVSDTVTLVSGINVNLDVDASGDAIRVATATDEHILDHHTIVSKTQTTTSVATVALDTFSATLFAGSETIVTAIQGTTRHMIKMLVTHDGTDVYETQYAELLTGNSLFTLTGDINSGNLRVLCTPTSTTSTKFNVYATRIEN